MRTYVCNVQSDDEQPLELPKLNFGQQPKDTDAGGQAEAAFQGKEAPLPLPALSFGRE